MKRTVPVYSDVRITEKPTDGMLVVKCGDVDQPVAVPESGSVLGQTADGPHGFTHDEIAYGAFCIYEEEKRKVIYSGQDAHWFMAIDRLTRIRAKGKQLPVIGTKEHYHDAERYFEERYEVLRFPFLADRPIRLQDHEDEASRRCRFCGKGNTEVTFRNAAHAIPEFLGNKAILSMNECDNCNTFLADNYEDHLSKWSLLGRAACQVRGKGGYPTFKNPSKTLKVSVGEKGLNIHLTDPSLAGKLMKEGGPYQFTVPADGTSQPYVPVRAGMALIKVACSLCPPAELGQCLGAIDWLMQRTDAAFTNLPVLYAFTPGPIGAASGEAVLLRRKHEGPEPYLWCIVQFGNHRFQVFVPFCPADGCWFKPNQPIKVTTKHFPSRFGLDWSFGPTTYGVLDWSGRELVRTDAKMTFHVERAIRTDKADPEQRNCSEG
jgi:hypothetical protein